MTYFKSKIYLLIVGSLYLFSCQEDEQVVFKGGTPPVLTASSTDELVLEKTEETYNSLQFTWTNPDYQFSNGTNTQDVTYTLEIDTAGSNFSNDDKVELAFSKELSKSFKVKDLNASLSALELDDYTPHNFEFRVKATLASGSVPLYSNVIGVTISTYLDVVFPVPDKLYITGAATPGNWMAGGDAPLASQEFTKINDYTFELASLQLNPSSGFLFVPVYGNWDNKYGFTGAGNTNNPSGDTFQPGGNDMISPSEGGNYKITVNFKTGKYSLIKL